MAFTLDLGGLVVHLGGEMSDFNEMIASAQAQVKNVTDKIEKMGQKVGEPLKQVGESFMKMGGAITAPIIGAAYVFDSFGSSLVDMNLRMGISVESLTELGYAASQSGGDIGSLEQGIRFMQRNLNQAALGSDQARKAFSQLKVPVGQLKALSPDKQFEVLAEAVRQIEDPAKRAAAVMGIFGRGATKLLPLMLEGKDGISSLRKEAQAYGMVVSTESAKAADKFGDSLVSMRLALKMISYTIGEQVAPMLQQMAMDVVRVSGTVINFIKENGKVIDTALKLGGAMTALGAAFYGAGTAVIWFAQAVSGLEKLLKLITASSVAALGWVAVAGLLAAGIALLVDGLMQFFDQGNLGLTDMITNWRVGGFKIQTWMASMISNMAKGLIWFVNLFKDSWEVLSNTVMDVLGLIYRTFVSIFAEIAKSALQYVQNIYATFSWLAENVITISAKLKILNPEEAEQAKQMLAGVGSALQTAQNDMTVGFRKVGESSLQASEERWAEYQKNVKRRAQDVASYDQAARDVFLEDLAEVESAKKKAEGPAKEAVAATTGTQDPFEKTAFKTMSLNRFALDGPEMGSPTGTQKVQDMGVIRAVNILTDVVRGKESVAVLG